MAEPSLLNQLVEAGVVPPGTRRVIIDVFAHEPTRLYIELGDDMLFDPVDWDGLEVGGDIATTKYDQWASTLPF